MIVTGAVCNDVAFVKYCLDFKAFSRNDERNIKYYFPGNVLDGWTFQ